MTFAPDDFAGRPCVAGLNQMGHAVAGSAIVSVALLPVAMLAICAWEVWQFKRRGVGTELTGSSHGMRRTTANVHGKMRLTQREKPWTVRARHLANRGGMTEMIRTWWPVAITVIAAIAWLIRLEARGISNGT